MKPNEKDWPWKDPLRVTKHYHIYLDKYPVTLNHMLFVPTENKPKYIKKAFEAALRTGNTMVDTRQIDAYNIGYNCGKEAGQTVMWPHIHLIPRRKDDCEDPTGGVRNVIPGKGNYLK